MSGGASVARDGPAVQVVPCAGLPGAPRLEKLFHHVEGAPLVNIERFTLVNGEQAQVADEGRAVFIRVVPVVGINKGVSLPAGNGPADGLDGFDFV